MDNLNENLSTTHIKKQLHNIVYLAHNQTDPIAKIPSMMTIQEQALLYNIASSYFCGDGSIIDAGHFLGASTYSFGLGLEANSSINYLDKNEKKYIYSYDLGLWWDSWTELAKSGKWLPYFDLFPECYKLKSFDSFIPVFKKACTQYLPIIDIHTGDIRPLLAKEGFSHSIEVLFLDICKLPSLNHMVSKTFFPKLIPNKSVLIQQDFLNRNASMKNVTEG